MRSWGSIAPLVSRHALKARIVPQIALMRRPVKEECCIGGIVCLTKYASVFSFDLFAAIVLKAEPSIFVTLRRRQVDLTLLS